MTTDITELAQLRAELSNPAVGSKDHLRKLALSLVEALEKAQTKNELVTGGIAVAEKLRERIAYLEKRLRGTEESLIASTDMVAELESRTVKLPDDEDGQAYGFGKWANGKLPATTGTMTISYCEDAWRAAFEVFSSAAGIKVEAE
ncbi:hypothetical protein AB3N53_09725 [Raoultella ornithinolytica]|uniref:hypothetical protein n=1 Tax=Raoultella ornithinolytica TaxID=54291 RepID=UPI0038783263